MSNIINKSVILSGAPRSRKPALSLPKGTCGCFCALLLLALASPAILRAQFQQPTDEELKMTADPKAPGAAAVYLYREEVLDSISNSQSVYVRIKVLTEKGKELATVSVPFRAGLGKVTEIRGRTIHADGTIIPFIEKPAELLDVKTKSFQENTMVFTLPSVEAGSILEYRYRLSGYISEQTWWIQQPYFIHKAHYSFHFNNRFSYLYAFRLPPNTRPALENLDTQTLDLTDVPPQPDEEWMPPLNTLRWHVEFYLTPLNNSKDFWIAAGKDWADMVRDFTSPTGGIKKVVAEIIAPADSDEQKAKKIYAAVQKLDNTAFSRVKSKTERKELKIKDIHKAEDVWKQKSGSDDEITLLYVALARAAGLKVWPMWVVNRNRAIFDKSYLSYQQFDDFIAVLVLDGKEIYLDPGQKMCPFGSLHWKHTLATGLRLAEKDAVISSTPADTYKSAVVHRIADLKIDEQGSLAGSARVVMTGPDALYWRQLALQNDEEEVKKQFIESIRTDLPEGVQAGLDHFIALDDYNSNLVGVFRISGSLGVVTGKHFFLPGLFFESRAKLPFVTQDKRLTPIDLHYAKMEQDDVVYRLPPGYTVESAPHTPDVAWPDHALLQISSAVKDGSVVARRALARNFPILDPKEYNDLHDFYQKIAAADQLQIVLTRTPAVKGNQP
jgi:hypothetical protein